MADNAAFSGPSEKGPPKWLMIGGAIAGVLGLVVLVTRNSGSGSTTAAGSSINAALGSLQEEQQNLLGTVQAGALANSANFQSLSGQLTDSTNGILSAITNQGTATQSQIQGAINTINANSNSNNQGLMAAITDALNQLMGSQQNLLSTVQSESQTLQSGIAGVNNTVNSGNSSILNAIGLGNTALGNQIAGIGSQVGDSTASIINQINGSQNIITNQNERLYQATASSLRWLGSGISGTQTSLDALTAGQMSTQQGINNLLTQLQTIAQQSNAQGVTIGQIDDWTNEIRTRLMSGDYSAPQATTNQLDAIQSFLNWEYYQLPGRYSAMIPGQTISVN